MNLQNGSTRSRELRTWTSRNSMGVKHRIRCRIFACGKRFELRSSGRPELVASYKAEAFLLDGAEPGSGKGFDWNRIETFRQRIILAGGLDETNVGEAIRRFQLWGVDACSRLEKAPGIKDHQKVARFVRAARGNLS